MYLPATIVLGDTSAMQVHGLCDTLRTNLAVFETWNGWGYYAVSFELRTDDERIVAITKKPTGFTRNGPFTFVIPPGEQMVVSINLASMTTSKGFLRTFGEGAVQWMPYAADGLPEDKNDFVVGVIEIYAEYCKS